MRPSLLTPSAVPRTRSNSRAVGRPSAYSEATARAICVRIAEGRSLRSICADDDMPALSTVYLWLRSQPEFSDQYARAREIQADALAAEVIEIADEEVTTALALERNKLRIEGRKWYAGKLRPRVYGEQKAPAVAIQNNVTRETSRYIRDE